MAGRKPYAPTEADRNTVRIMIAAGMPQDIVATCIGDHGISGPTLRKHFRREIETASAKANAAVAARLYERALNDPNPAWAIFWLKTRAGWQERNRHELTGADGAPLVTLRDIDRIVGDE